MPMAKTAESRPRDPSLSWTSIRAQFPIVERMVPVLDGTPRHLLYLDHAASTHAPTVVLDRHLQFLAQEYANVHRGAHHLSRQATETFDACYE